MTALSRGPSAMTARKRCEDMTPSWHDGGDGERSVRSGQSGSADQQSSRHERASGQDHVVSTMPELPSIIEPHAPSN